MKERSMACERSFSESRWHSCRAMWIETSLPSLTEWAEVHCLFRAYAWLHADERDNFNGSSKEENPVSIESIFNDVREETLTPSQIDLRSLTSQWQSPPGRYLVVMALGLDASTARARVWMMGNCLENGWILTGLHFRRQREVQEIEDSQVIRNIRHICALGV